MDPLGGMQSVEKLRQAGNGEGKMYIINNAGHHCTSSPPITIKLSNKSAVYLDNPDATNSLLTKELDKRHRAYGNVWENDQDSDSVSSDSSSKEYHDFLAT